MPKLLYNPISGVFDLSGDGSSGNSISGFIQQVQFTSSDLASTTAQIAADTFTAPSVTDGDQWATLSINPVSENNILLIEGNIISSSTGASGFQIAIFDGISDTAVATFYGYGQTGAVINNTTFSFIYQPASADPLTFSLRYGVTNALGGTVYALINGITVATTPTQVGEGVAYSSWTITEIANQPSTPFQITITGNDDTPITGSNFTIVGVNGMTNTWSAEDTEFLISPPDTITWGPNIISADSGTLVTGNSNILTNGSATSVALPSNSGVVVGDVVEVIGLCPGFTITQAANQVIQFGSQSSSVGSSGTLSTTQLGSSILLRLCSIGAGVYTWVAANAPQGSYITA